MSDLSSAVLKARNHDVQASTFQTPSSLSELDKILVRIPLFCAIRSLLFAVQGLQYLIYVMQCSSDTSAESHALDFMKKLKEDGVVKAYGGAQQVLIVAERIKQIHKLVLTCKVTTSVCTILQGCKHSLFVDRI